MDTLSPPEITADDAPAQDDDGRAPGSLVAGRYRLIERIGDGAMGAVYLAEHEGLHRQVALKFLHDEFTGNREIAARFAREAVAAARLEHPNVIAVYDSGTDERGRCFLAMEYVEGELLREVLDRDGALRMDRVIRFARQIAAALDHAHALGIVHRDIKPENVLVVRRVDAADVVKVIDFGIAKVFLPDGPAGSALTRSGIVLGTPEYMAPEQALGGEVDHRADVYALAVVTYEMLAGRRPFGGDDVMTILMAHINAPPPPPSRARPDGEVPPAVDEVFAKGLAKTPNNRHRSPSEFVDDLERAVAAPVVQRTATEPVPPDEDDATPTATAPAALAAPVAPGADAHERLRGGLVVAAAHARAVYAGGVARWRGASHRAQLAVAVGTLVATVALVGVASRRRPEPEPEPAAAAVPRARPARGGAAPVAQDARVDPANDLGARIEALRRRPDLATGSLRERQQAAQVLEELRTRSPDDAAVAYVLGAVYARDRATSPLSLGAYRDAVREAPDLAFDEALLDDVVRIYTTSPALAAPSEALLRGPLADAALDRLLEASQRGGPGRARVAALLAAPPFADRVDPTQRGLLALSAARSCEARRAAVEALGREADARALPALRRLPTESRCGFLNLSTCGTCLSSVVPAAITAIEARAPDAG